MNDLPPVTISTEVEFLAHVIALKHESEDRLQSMADCLSEHNNPEAAKVFADLAGFVRHNIQHLESEAAGLQLPEIPPWEYLWHCSNDPEAICMDHAHYMMSVRESLQLALFNEQRSVKFLNRVYSDVDHAGVMELALHQIKTEQQFATVIQQRLDSLGENEEFCEDLDPPHMPE